MSRTIVIIDRAVENWEWWAYARELRGLERVHAPFYLHDCNYYPRKVPRCPACEAGIPVRVVKSERDLWDEILGEMLEVEVKR